MKSNLIRAVVTGGASGLGRATCEEIIKEGGQVVLLDNNTELGKATCSELGPKSYFFQVDVTSEKNVDQTMEQAVAALGSINLLVNCAGIAPSQRLLGKEGLMTTAQFQQTININLVGSFSVCRAAINHMQHNEVDDQGQRAVIINTASIAAQDGQVGQAAYAASKAGIIGMMLPLAREFSRIGVRVVSVAPGLFQTPLMAKLPEQAITDLQSQIPFPKRLGRPDEFGRLVCHIYENHMLNGEVIRLDGALRM